MIVDAFSVSALPTQPTLGVDVTVTHIVGQVGRNDFAFAWVLAKSKMAENKNSDIRAVFNTGTTGDNSGEVNAWCKFFFILCVF
jgi:hypothetical protein